MTPVCRAHIWTSFSRVNTRCATGGKRPRPVRADWNIPTCSAEKACAIEPSSASAFSGCVDLSSLYLLTYSYCIQYSNAVDAASGRACKNFQFSNAQRLRTEWMSLQKDELINCIQWTFLVVSSIHLFNSFTKVSKSARSINNKWNRNLPRRLLQLSNDHLAPKSVYTNPTLTLTQNDNGRNRTDGLQKVK